jgi:hypothetical protein
MIAARFFPLLPKKRRPFFFIKKKSLNKRKTKMVCTGCLINFSTSSRLIIVLRSSSNVGLRSISILCASSATLFILIRFQKFKKKHFLYFSPLINAIGTR